MEIFREFTFEAAHRLTHVPDGHKCARLHGHSYRVEIHVAGPVGEETGWVMDFQEIKDAFAPLHDQLDHHYLNEVDGPGQPDQREPGPLDLGPAHRRTAARPGRRPRDLHLGMHLPGRGGLMLEDVQDRRDDRHLPIDEVGISGIRYPVAVSDREHGKQDTIAEVSMSVDLRPDVKGAHLSRFVEVLHDSRRSSRPPGHAGHPRTHCGSAWPPAGPAWSSGFPYFLRRAAPVTGAAALMDYQCWLSGRTGRQRHAAHASACGYRSPASARAARRSATTGPTTSAGTSPSGVRPRDEDGEPAAVWAEDLIEIAEAAASSPVFPLLKRPDERHVTMHAHDHPVFVEDMAAGRRRRTERRRADRPGSASKRPATRASTTTARLPGSSPRAARPDGHRR